jgi:hypothetical protein
LSLILLEEGEKKEECKCFARDFVVHVAVPVVGAAAFVYAVPIVVTAVGFTSSGITAGSWASSIMSATAIANGGGVSAASLCAALQSIGVVGLTSAQMATIGIVGAGVTYKVMLHADSKIKEILCNCEE